MSVTNHALIKYGDVIYYLLLTPYDKFDYFTLDVSLTFNSGRLHNILHDAYM